MVDRAALEMRCTGNCTGGSNPSLSALNSLQGVDFQPCRLFFVPKKLHQKMHRPRFYALLRAFFKFRSFIDEHERGVEPEEEG